MVDFFADLVLMKNQSIAVDYLLAISEQKGRKNAFDFKY